MVIPHYSEDLTLAERLVTNEPLGDLVDDLPVAPYQTIGPLVHLEVASAPSAQRARTRKIRDQRNHSGTILGKTAGLSVSSGEPFRDLAREEAEYNSPGI